MLKQNLKSLSIFKYYEYFNKIKILHFLVNLIINVKPINFQKTYEINNF